MVETLLDYGADVDALYYQCEKPLHYAAKNLDTGEDVALALIHQGSAKVDAFHRYISVSIGKERHNIFGRRAYFIGCESVREGTYRFIRLYKQGEISVLKRRMLLLQASNEIAVKKISAC